MKFQSIAARPLKKQIHGFYRIKNYLEGIISKCLIKKVLLKTGACNTDVCNFIKKRQGIFCEFCAICKDSNFVEDLQTVASENPRAAIVSKSFT